MIDISFSETRYLQLSRYFPGRYDRLSQSRPISKASLSGIALTVGRGSRIGSSGGYT